MFLIACQKETVKERGLVWYLYLYIHLEAGEKVCRGCCCRCLTQRELICNLQSPWGTSEHWQISAKCSISIFSAGLLNRLRKLL